MMKILASDEKTLPSLVQYGFIKGLPLLSGMLVSTQDASLWFLTDQNILQHRVAFRRQDGRLHLLGLPSEPSRSSVAIRQLLVLYWGSPSRASFHA